MNCLTVGRWSSLLVTSLLLAACTLPGAQADSLPSPIPTQTTRPTRVPVVTVMPRPTITPTRTPMLTYTATPTIEPIPTRTPTITLPPTSTPIPTPTYLFTGTPGTPVPGCAGTPASSNLLVNSGFEGGQHQQESQDINVPDGWAAFWIPGGTPVNYDPQNTDGYQRPEMRVINNQPPYDNPPRVYEGVQAFRMVGNGRVFDAGLMQQVNVTPGDMFCLGGFAHAWSVLRGDDLFHSTLNSPDDRRNASFQLGIDPLGGTNPWASTVTWGQTGNLYDVYQPITPVQTYAQSGTITVFVRGIILWRFNHNEMFFDGITLARVIP